MDTMIPYYNIKNINQQNINELSTVAEEIIQKGNFLFSTDKFEEEFADYVGSKYCIAVSSGTSALHLALLALGIQPGDEVITVSHTFRATISAILYCSAVPIFVDIDPDTFTIDCDQIENKITNKTKCILPVHMYGNMCNMYKLKEIAKKYSLPIIEDSSQAHGSYYDNRHSGTIGDIGTFSFYPGKGLGALGDAGAVVTDNKEIYDYIVKTRSWNENSVGFNYRMDTMQAEFLRVKLKSFPSILESKIEIANLYNKHFSYVKTHKLVKHSYHIYPVLVNNRNELIKKLQNVIELKTHYDKPVHKFPYYKFDNKLPVTEKISNVQVSLPIYPGVPAEKIIDTIKNEVEKNDYSSFL